MTNDFPLQLLGRYKDHDLLFVNQSTLVMAMNDHQAFYGAWPYEGTFVKSKWVYHTGTIMDGTTEIEVAGKPLLVDASSARAWCLVYDVLSDKNKAKMDEFIQSRGLFCWAMETLVWPHVGFGARK